MRRTIGAIAALSLVISLFANTPRAVLAANISKIESGPQSLHLTIEGEIKTGDASRIISVIEKNKPEAPKARKLWLFVFLSSTGGDLQEAFRLGRYLRSQDAFTAVPAGAKCYSSCVFVLVSGVLRTKGPTGEIGVHRPYLIQASEDTNFEESYRRAHEAVTTYLREMHINRSLGELIFSVPPEYMKLLSHEEFERLIGIDDPVFDEEGVADAAKIYGISSAEYRKREARAYDVCDRMFSQGQAKAEYGACIKAILQGGNSRAQCFSDEELLDVLRGVFLNSMGQTLGICARKYPSLESSAFQTVESFEATYSYQKNRLERRTVAAFEKNYPGRGKQARNENERQASLTAASQAEAFSKLQCEQSLYGVQLLVRANDWEQIMAPAGVFFREERARIPRCS